MRWLLIVVLLNACSTHGESSGGHSPDEKHKGSALIRMVEGESWWVVGSACGLGNGPAPGRATVERYIRDGAIDALRQLARDADPSARVYGVSTGT